MHKLRTFNIANLPFNATREMFCIYSKIVMTIAYPSLNGVKGAATKLGAL